MAGKRKLNPKLVKARHSYTFAEIAEIFNLHKRTVQSWRKEGLKVIDDKTKPYLVIGEDVRLFLHEKAKKRKQPLKAGEFFCPKCRSPRKSDPDKFRIEITDKKLGKNYRLVLIKGICEVCNTRLMLFSSDRKLEEMIKNGVLPTEHKTNIYGSGGSSLNTDIKEVENG
jgi:hypothetical protein